MLLSARLVLGGYLSVHGAQKLFGVFGGHGLDTTGQAFERIGLTPGRPMAALAGATELAGGLLAALSLAKLTAAQKASAADQHVPPVPAPDEPAAATEAGASSAGAEA